MGPEPLALASILGRVREQVHALSGLHGPAADVLSRLEREVRALAPQSVAGLEELVRHLGERGVDPSRVELDLGFGRGIGFYTQMIFELAVQTPRARSESAAAAATTAWPACSAATATTAASASHSAWNDWPRSPGTCPTAQSSIALSLRERAGVRAPGPRDLHDLVPGPMRPRTR